MKSLLLIATLMVAFTINSQSTIDKNIQSGGITRSYKLYIPASYTGSSSVALVLNMHGLGSTSQQQMFYGDFRAIADTANFIIAHPQGTVETTTLGRTYWNAYFGGAVDDISFLSELIDTISSNYNIDINRIHSTGMSNGGYMSLAIAAGLHDKIASVASVTGSMTQTFPVSAINQYPISVMQIHGTADSTVKYVGDTASQSIQNVLNYWLLHNNITSSPVVDSLPDINTTDNSTAIKYTYSGGTDNTEVIHYKVIDGAHTWPNALISIGVTNRDFDASREIWKFFNRNRKVNTVGVNEIEKAELVSFFNDYINSRLNVTNLSKANLEYSIVDISGKKIGGDQLINKTNYIETQSFNSGIYILRIKEINSNRFSSYKFVVR